MDMDYGYGYGMRLSLPGLSLFLETKQARDQERKFEETKQFIYLPSLLLIAAEASEHADQTIYHWLAVVGLSARETKGRVKEKWIWTANSTRSVDLHHINVHKNQPALILNDCF